MVGRCEGKRWEREEERETVRRMKGWERWRGERSVEENVEGRLWRGDEGREVWGEEGKKVQRWERLE